jgi:hypothetical protein
MLIVVASGDLSIKQLLPAPQSPHLQLELAIMIKLPIVRLAYRKTVGPIPLPPQH